MPTRIKYKKHAEREIYYSKQYVAGTKLINATIINRTEGDGKFQVIIHELNEGIVLFEQLCPSYNRAKQVVKGKFKEYGVAILDEVRKKVEFPIVPEIDINDL